MTRRERIEGEWEGAKKSGELQKINFDKDGSPKLSTDLGFIMGPRVWTSEGPICNTFSGQFEFLMNLINLFLFLLLILISVLKK